MNESMALSDTGIENCGQSLWTRWNHITARMLLGYNKPARKTN